jgi:hypothetical protein
VVALGVAAGEIEVAVANPSVEGDVLLLQPVGLVSAFDCLAVEARLRA